MNDGRARRHRRLLVWDLDGTVVDSYRAIQVAVDAALDAHGLRPAERRGTTEVVLRSLVGLSLDRIFGRLVTHRAPGTELIEALVATYHRAFRAEAADHARLVPGMVPLLADLRDRGVVSVVASSDRIGAHVLLDAFGIADLFSAVVSDDDVHRHQRKPHPEMVSLARRLFSCEPGETMVIGASVFDVEMGQAAGVRTVGVTWGNHSRGDLLERSPTHLVDDVDGLASYLGVATGDGGAGVADLGFSAAVSVGGGYPELSGAMPRVGWGVP